MNEDFLAYLQGRRQSQNAYSAGDKLYGPAGRSAPNVGPVQNMGGYRERDNRAAQMKSAMMRRLKALRQGKYASANAQRPIASVYPGPGGF